MDKFPVYLNGDSVGELTVDRESCYTRFTVQAELPEGGLWCLWVVGDQKEFRLGILEPGDNGAWIRRRFSNQFVTPVGKILRGEIRSVRREYGEWEPVESIEQVTDSMWLRKKLRGQSGLLRKQCRKGQYIAVPYDKEKCFAVIEMFCFARLLNIAGGLYLTLLFNEQEQVVFALDAADF